MTFVLLIGSVMSISIFIIYRLCRFLHIEMKFSSLVLCAILAVAINAFVAYLSPFLDEAHFIRLGLLVVFSAAFVTIYNEHLVRRSEKACPVETTTLATATTPNAEANITTVTTVVDSINDEAPVTPPVESTAEFQSNVTEPVDRVEKIIAEPDNDAKLQTEAELIAKKRAAAAKKANELAELQSKSVESTAKISTEPAENKKSPTKKAITIPTYVSEIAKLDSLDAILDYAYEKQQVDPSAAIWAYKQAIKRYADDDYVPFLIIELGNIYKNQADYKNTINTYIAALKLPIIATNDTMRAEFSKNLRYLGVVQDILNQHQALDTPFAQIPPAIMQEIEAEYQRRLNASS